MNQESKDYSDPLIDEVRERRRQLWARYGNDLDKFYAAIKRRQAEHPERIVRAVPPTRQTM